MHGRLDVCIINTCEVYNCESVCVCVRVCVSDLCVGVLIYMYVTVYA